MNTVTNRDINMLKNEKPTYKISIYIPILPGVVNSKKNISRLNSTVKTLKEKLIQDDMPSRYVNRIVDSVRGLINQVARPKQSGSLVIFANAKDQHVYFSPEQEDWLLYINDNYLLNPLVEASKDHGGPRVTLPMVEKFA